MPKRSKIPEDVRLFIVERLAVFDTPQIVAEAVKAEFCLQITRQIIEKYDPTKVNGANVCARFRERFFRIREKFRRDLDDIPIASKAVRLRRLDQMATALQDQGNYLGAAQLLEQAAKEMGGFYMRAAEASNKVNEPLEPKHPGHDVLREIAERYAFPVANGGEKKH